MPQRKVLLVVIGVLGVVAIVFGYQLYQESQQSDSIEINIGKRGITIEKR